MIKYKIVDVAFIIDGEDLLVNNEPHSLKKATLESLSLFLQSGGGIISKDDLLDYVWKDVIVSEASAFKQVQLVRALFIKLGLPKDIIENIYGKGYRIKYAIEELSEKEVSAVLLNDPQKSEKHLFRGRYYAVLLIVLLAIVIFIYKYPSHTTDYLMAEKKDSIINLMRGDWEKGLQHIDDILTENSSELSKADLAFLYAKKGLSEQHIQNYKESIESFELALGFHKSLKKSAEQGQVHLDMATSFGLSAKTNDNLTKRQAHINKAITLFEQTGSQVKMIDAQMTLSSYYQDVGKLEESIMLLKKTVKDAQSIGDKTGEMIANNNLAASYTLINDYDKAIELGQKGLHMTLAIGKGRYIASSYSFLSDLYLHQYKSVEAMEMIEQAIKYQLASNEYSHLVTKLITLNFLLVQTYQHQRATDLLVLSDKYVKSLEMDDGISILLLYKGLNLARQNNWADAEESLSESLEIAQSINFNYKQPLNLAYLALSYYFNNSYLQSIEPAMSVMNDEKSSQHSRAIAALALAYTYSLIEKLDLADKWFVETERLLSPKWLFEYQLFLKLKLERQVQSKSILISQTENEIETLGRQMLELAQRAQVDEKIFSDLQVQVAKKVAEKIKAE